MAEEDGLLQKLHIRLLTSDVKRVDQALHDSRGFNSYDLKQNPNFSGRLYIAPAKTTPPPWLDFVQTGAAKKVEQLGNRSNAVQY